LTISSQETIIPLLGERIVMDIVFESLIFLNIGLLAITITVFVLAVSLLGRAVRLSVEKMAEAEENLRKKTAENIKAMRESLGKTKPESGILTRQPEINKLLQDLNKQRKIESAIGRRIWWTRLKPKFMSVILGVIMPSLCFIGSMSLGIIARYELNIEPSTLTSPYLYLMIVLLALGICLVFVALKVIEGVAVTSEDVGYMREKEVFLSALDEHDESKRPMLVLTWHDTKPPFKVPSGSTINVEYVVGMTKGRIADSVVIGIHLPAVFNYPKGASIIQSSDKGVISGFKTWAEYLNRPLLAGVGDRCSLTFQAPNQKGTFTGYYSLACKDMIASPFEPFDVIVE
jgi:hypothetical protein